MTAVEVGEKFLGEAHRKDACPFCVLCFHSPPLFYVED